MCFKEPRGNKLNWSASMVITIAHDFDAVFGNLIPSDSDPYWVAITMNCRFVSLLMQLRFTRQQLLGLQDMWYDVKIRVRECWNRLADKWKFHFCDHTISQIAKFGLPIQMWCRPVETKHLDIRNETEILNDKNLAFQIVDLASWRLAMGVYKRRFSECLSENSKIFTPISLSENVELTEDACIFHQLVGLFGHEILSQNNTISAQR